ncbi:hypothetical protein JW964_00745, partial [candidate division KSB1 bacterium]|nr:hypothetical protein [candidate division KSB1 bacterium]
MFLFHAERGEESVILCRIRYLQIIHLTKLALSFFLNEHGTQNVRIYFDFLRGYEILDIFDTGVFGQ